MTAGRCYIGVLVLDYDISPHASTAYLPLAILDARTPGTCPNLCMINSRVRLCYPL